MAKNLSEIVKCFKLVKYKIYMAPCCKTQFNKTVLLEKVLNSTAFFYTDPLEHHL